MTKPSNGAVKKTGAVLGIFVAVVTIFAYMGILPWATRADVAEIKHDTNVRMERIEKKVDDIHLLFFPRGRRGN